jgi:hypothetical protein
MARLTKCQPGSISLSVGVKWGQLPDRDHKSWWDRINPFSQGSDLVGQFGGTGQAASEASEAAEAAEELDREAGGGGGNAGLGILGGVGIIAGGLNTAHGISELYNGKTADGIYDVGTGVLGMGQGVTSVASEFVNEDSALGGMLGPAGGVMQAMAGAMQLGKGAAEAKNGGIWNGAFDLLQGGANTTAGVATLAGAAPVAAVASAGALGMAGGKVWADYTENNSKGNFGTDEFGHQRSAYDAAADTGIAAHHWVDNLIGAKYGSDSTGDTVGNIAGGITAAGAGIWNTLENTGDKLGDLAYRWLH